jgi:hypothetical protein
MRKVVLISCASKKLPHRAKAVELYISPLFKRSLEYARALKPDLIYILSSKHGLLELESEIEPYDVTLNQMSRAAVRTWARLVVAQLQQSTDIKHDHFVFLAGERYRKYLTPHLPYFELPTRGLAIGKQMQYLTACLSEDTLAAPF